MFKYSLQESAIGRQFVFYTLIFSSCIALVFTLIQVQREYVREQQKYLQFEQVIEHSLLASLSNSVWAYDDSQIYAQLVGMKRLPGVQRVHLFMAEEGQFSVGESSADFSHSKVFPVIYEKSGFSQYMGELTVYSSMDQRYVYLLEYGGLILAVNVAKTLCVVAFMFFLFELLISRHLHRISAQLKYFNRSEQPILISLNRKEGTYKDELDLVVDAINNLQQRVFFEQCKFSNEIKNQARTHQEIIEKKQQLHELEHNIGLNEFVLGLRVEIRKPLFKLKNHCEGLHHLANSIPYDRVAVNSGLEDIAQSIHQAIEIIERSNNLFKYQKPQPSIVDISRTIEKVTTLLSHDFYAASIVVNHHSRHNVVEALVDKSHIEQVILCVLKNALEALIQSEQGDKRVEISAFVTQENIELHIEDNGGGVQYHLLEKLFIPYYTTKASGLGIGLSLTRSLLTEMGGVITASNNANGLSIVINLPAS